MDFQHRIKLIILSIFFILSCDANISSSNKVSNPKKLSSDQGYLSFQNEVYRAHNVCLNKSVGCGITPNRQPHPIITPDQMLSFGNYIMKDIQTFLFVINPKRFKKNVWPHVVHV